MSRYIDVDKLKRKKKYSFQTEFGAFPKHEYFIKLDDLLYTPTVDVKPVIHVEWIKNEQGYRICSICGKEPLLKEDPYSDYYDMVLSKFCPHCGADLIGV